MSRAPTRQQQYHPALLVCGGIGWCTTTSCTWMTVVRCAKCCRRPCQFWVVRQTPEQNGFARRHALWNYRDWTTELAKAAYHRTRPMGRALL